MRAVLFAIGAIFLTTYPVILLFSLAGNLAPSQQKVKLRPAVLSVGTFPRRAESEPTRRRVRRNPVLRRNSSD